MVRELWSRLALWQLSAFHSEPGLRQPLLLQLEHPPQMPRQPINCMYADQKAMRASSNSACTCGVQDAPVRMRASASPHQQERSQCHSCSLDTADQQCSAPGGAVRSQTASQITKSRAPFSSARTSCRQSCILPLDSTA